MLASDDGVKCRRRQRHDGQRTNLDKIVLGGGPGGGDQADDSKEVVITGGTLSSSDAEGDGLDSNGNVNEQWNRDCQCGPTQGGNGALDYNGTFEITGGTPRRCRNPLIWQ